MERKNYSLISALRGLIVLIFIMMLLNFTYCIFSLIQIRERNYNAAEYSLINIAASQRKRLDAIERFTEWALLKEPDVRTISSDPHIGSHLVPLRNLRDLIKERADSLGETTAFFLHVKNGDHFYGLSSVQTGYEEYVRIEDMLRMCSIETNNRLIWKTLQKDDKNYIYFQVNYKGDTMIALIDTDELATEYITNSVNIPLNIELTGPGDTVLYRSAASFTGPFVKNIEADGAKTTLPYTVRIFSSFFDGYGNQLILQLTLISFFLILAAFSFYYLKRLYNRIIRPIESFHENLSKINESSETLLDAQGIKELEQTNTQFRSLFAEINKLKINMYERELEQAHSELEMLQHQIKPHFYLNCLSTISSMLEVGETELAEKMIRFTSVYLRYLFQSDNKYAQLINELEHIDAYLNIQSLRLFSPINYTCEADPECLDALVPPLLLITFVENSVKHGADPDKSLCISLGIKRIETEKGNFLQFELKDTGPGFSDEALALLSGDAFYPEEKGHVGIRNSLKRLRIMYQNDFSISFSNNDDGGACITLRIPFVLEMDHI